MGCDCGFSARLGHARARGARAYNFLLLLLSIINSAFLFLFFKKPHPDSSTIRARRGRFPEIHVRHRGQVGNLIVNLRHLFPRVTLEHDFIDTGYATAVTSTADHPSRSTTCVFFAKPSFLGVTEPFLTQKTAFLLNVYRFLSRFSKTFSRKAVFA
jgi:hypothetical protein